MSERLEWFQRQMDRLYAARGLEPNESQVAVYWRAIGGRRSESNVLVFTDTEISAAFTRAIETLPVKFGIWSLDALLGLCRDEKARQRPARNAGPAIAPPPLPEPPPEVLAQGREAIIAFYLGPKPEAAIPDPPKPKKTFEPREPASDRTWHQIGALARQLLSPAPDDRGRDVISHVDHSGATSP
jgi:hypothetical protein